MHPLQYHSFEIYDTIYNVLAIVPLRAVIRFEHICLSIKYCGKLKSPIKKEELKIEKSEKKSPLDIQS